MFLGEKRYFVPFCLIVHVSCMISLFHLGLETYYFATSEIDALISFTIHWNNCEFCRLLCTSPNSHWLD